MGWFKRDDSSQQPASPPLPSSSIDPDLADLMAYEQANSDVVDALDAVDAFHHGLIANGKHPWKTPLASQRMAALTWTAYLCQIIGNELLEEASTLGRDIPPDVVELAIQAYKRSKDWSRAAKALADDPTIPFDHPLPFVPLKWPNAQGRSSAYAAAMARACASAQARTQKSYDDITGPSKSPDFDQALRAIKTEMGDVNSQADHTIALQRASSGGSARLINEIVEAAHMALSSYFAMCQKMSIPMLLNISIVPQYSPAANAVPPTVKQAAKPQPTGPQFNPTDSAPQAPQPRPSVPQFNPTAPPARVSPPPPKSPQFDPSSTREADPPPRSAPKRPQFDPSSTATMPDPPRRSTAPQFDPTRTYE